MNILFLADDQNRIQKFKKEVPLATIVTTAKACIKALSKAEDIWNIVFLSHDLGEGAFVDSGSKNSGMEVVRWISKNQPCIRNIIVHTCNPDAGYEMEAELTKAQYEVSYIPFTTLIHNLKVINHD